MQWANYLCVTADLACSVWWCCWCTSMCCPPFPLLTVLCTGWDANGTNCTVLRELSFSSPVWLKASWEVHMYVYIYLYIAVGHTGQHSRTLPHCWLLALGRQWLALDHDWTNCSHVSLSEKIDLLLVNSTPTAAPFWCKFEAHAHTANRLPVRVLVLSCWVIAKSLLVWCQLSDGEMTSCQQHGSQPESHKVFSESTIGIPLQACFGNCLIFASMFC